MLSNKDYMILIHSCDACTTLELQLAAMQCGLEKLQSELQTARSKLARYENLFTAEEQRHLQSEKRLHWKCKETLSKSIIDQMTGPKSYDLRRYRVFPLPLTAQLKLEEGFLELVFDWKCNRQGGRGVREVEEGELNKY